MTPATPKVEQSQIPECIPELDSPIMAELEAPELLLKPRTYSPAPSSKSKSINHTSMLAPQLAVELSAPISPSNSVNFSEVNSPLILQKQSSFSSRDSIHSKQGNHQGEVTLNEHSSTHLTISNSKPLASPKSIQTPPSRGFDSAYCSDLEKTSPQLFTPLPTPKIQQTPNIKISTTGCEKRSHLDRNLPSLLTPISIQNPDLNYFRPVNASPHSPLQRTWTASPTQNPLHARPDSSGSNLSNFSAYSRRNESGKISNSGNKKNSTVTSRHVPSAMGRSVLTHTDEKMPKKRRGVFNWIKDQFSLNEEERISFEQKLKANKDRSFSTKINRESGYEGRKWIDGKRVERGKMVRNGRLKK